MPRRKKNGLFKTAGFSLIELMVSLLIMLVLLAIAIPGFSRANRTYQLNASANQVAGIIKMTRLEAIRRNTPTTFQIQQTGTNWTAWTDSNKNGAVDATETQYLTSASGNLLAAAAVPSAANLTSALITALSISSVTVRSGTNNANVIFDSRGAVSFGAGAPAVYVFYIGNVTDTNAGFRAVVLLPSGITRVWTASSGSSTATWRRIS